MTAVTMTAEQLQSMMVEVANRFLQQPSLSAGMQIMFDPDHENLVIVGYPNGYAAEFWFSTIPTTEESEYGDIYTDLVPVIHVSLVYMQNGVADPASEEEKSLPWRSVHGALQYGICKVYDQETELHFDVQE
jgi:hypothetical protein